MTGLEGVGVPGREHLREALTTCSDPLAAIEEFQVQNGILLPSLRPALPFLDLHGVKRLEFHGSVMEELRERMLTRIKEIAESTDKNKFKLLNDLLVKSFPVVKVKTLQPVVMCIMQHLPKIKQEYLNAVMNDPDLYKEAAIEVKQQIWQDRQALFGDEVSPLLSKYIEDKEAMLFSNDFVIGQTFFTPSPKARRQAEVVVKLTQMIGKNVKLYDMMLQFLRTLFLRTRNVHYCTLRAELLMALHDLEIHEICSIDPCHKFTWCLDACIRERFVDSKRARELQGFLDSVRRGQEQVLGDLAMILCDPYAVNTVAMSAMRALTHSANIEGIPRHNDELVQLLRMLSLGLGAWRMIDSQLFREPKLDSSLVIKFLPSVLSLMVDDHMHQVSAKIPDEPIPQVEPVPEWALIPSRDGAVACTVLMYYALQVSRQKDILGVCRILPALAQCDADIVYQDTVLHLLVANLAAMGDNFINIDFCSAVMDQFFLPSVSQENVERHLLRLLWWVHPKMLPNKLTQLMEMLKPNNTHSKHVHEVYTELADKIANYNQPVVPPEPVEAKLDTPLMSVPAPTPSHP